MKTWMTKGAALVVACAAAGAYADLRVVHASPDAPPVDVYVNTTPGAGAPAIVNLPFTNATPYIGLPTGNYNFQVTPTGATAPVVINADAAINASTFYTVAATGFLSDIQATIFVDDNTPAQGQARVRFIHASPDVPNVDITTAGGAATLFDNVAFRTSGGYITVPAGTYDLEVRLDSSGAVALPVPGVTLEPNTVYTVWAMGSLRTQNVQAVVTIDAIPAPGAAAMLGLAGLAAARRRRSR